jgi:hypothetical protein
MQINNILHGGDSNLYGYVLGDPINGVDPWGLDGGSISSISNGLNYTSGYINAYVDFWRNSARLEKGKIINSDKYFHCMANCQATNWGQGGKDAAQYLSIFKEWFDENIKGRSREDCLSDLEADWQGQKGGNCKETCSQYEVPGIEPWLW